MNLRDTVRFAAAAALRTENVLRTEQVVQKVSNIALQRTRVMGLLSSHQTANNSFWNFHWIIMATCLQWQAISSQHMVLVTNSRRQEIMFWPFQQPSARNTSEIKTDRKDEATNRVSVIRENSSNSRAFHLAEYLLFSCWFREREP